MSTQRSVSSGANTSRQQQLMGQAIDHISAQKGKAWKDTYGGLYHRLPVLIRTCGLCQALAFVASKQVAGGDRGDAHKRVMEDVKEVLTAHCGVEVQGDEEILNAVRKLDAPHYALATRILLQSLVFHKRFAESILGVKADDYNGGDDGAAQLDGGTG